MGHENRKPFTRPDFHLLPKMINGGIAGMIGVSVVFPLDLVKTRLQNQTFGPKGEKQYKNMLDCLIQTYKADGYFGMYRGSAVNIILITPEKAIKLASFDFFRYYLTMPDGYVTLKNNTKAYNSNCGNCDTAKMTTKLEITMEDETFIPGYPHFRTQPIRRISLAGALAGCCQIIVTCPMELLKIQLQDAGRIAAQAKKEGKPFKRTTALQITKKILREQGVFGLYRGITATALREIYFSVVYFPVFIMFNNLGKTGPERKGPAPFWWTFMGGFLGGVASAIAVNPFDVAKTRLQTITKGKNDREYKGLIDCIVKTYHYEGISAFMKGIGCRIAIVAPLFGIAQTVYYIGIGEYILGLPRVL